MADELRKLWDEANRYLQAGRAADAACYLAELVSLSPADRQTRVTLAGALAQAGDTDGALSIMRALADRLAHEGYLLPAIAVARQGLTAAPDDPRLLEILRGLHVRGMRAKAGQLAVPPPLKPKAASTGSVKALALMGMSLADRMERIASAGCEFPPAGASATPVPMPLFGELDTDAFLATVARLRYNRVPPGTALLEEGKPGDTLLIMVSGQIAVSKGGATLAQLGPGSVLGEMALITGAPRSATVTAVDVAEYFELSRADVGAIAKHQPTVAQELVEYCRRRLLGNLLRTSPLFSKFDEATRLSLLGRFKTISFAADETIIVQGEPATGLYLIASGEVEVKISNADGDMVTVATLGPGQVFGEISLIKNQPTTAYVTAKGTVGALILETTAFQMVVQEHPEVRQYLEGLTADRIKASRDAADASGFIDPDDVIVL
jgi:CRP-like cAMP-binding protein